MLLILINAAKFLTTSIFDLLPKVAGVKSLPRGSHSVFLRGKFTNSIFS